MALTSMIAAAASAVAGGMYLDAKYNIRDDLAQLRGGRKVAKYLQRHQQLNGDEDYSFYHILHMSYDANHHTNTEALVFEDRSWTYRQLREEIGRLAEAFQRMGIRNRTVVAMLANNSPEFVVAWWALYKLGAIPAPINTGITGEHIRHCIKVCSAEYLLSTYELHDVVAKTLSPDSDSAPQSGDFVHISLPTLKQVILYDYDTYPHPTSTSPPLGHTTHVLKHTTLQPPTAQSALFPKSTRPRITATCASQYLFTSGTTGLPKVLNWPAAYSFQVGASDRWPHMHTRPRRWYVCLPMFHGTATFAILPACHATSGTIVLARRFSRRAFWSDVRRHNIDSVLYIGEMLRYLVQAPHDTAAFPDGDETKHSVELCYGLGLAPSVWTAMRERFGVPWIAEYYSASEATGALCNSNRNAFGVGMVARWGPIMRSKWFGQQTFYIVRTDFESGELVRDPRTGFCEVVDVGEVGEILSRVAPPVQRRHEYVGEGSAEANDKKYLRDVFRKGDEFTRLGDAVAIDANGFIKFHDRLGDTYRAKGHNISTTEVEAWLSRHPSIASVNVYAIPMNRYGYDGQVGCAALTLRPTTTTTSSDAADATEADLISHLEHWLRTSDSALPAYAVPRFVRILVDAGATSDQEGMGGDTGSDRVSLIMKKLKTGLRRDGFVVPRASGDRMYWLRREGEGFVRLNDADREVLLSGKARL